MRGPYRTSARNWIRVSASRRPVTTGDCPPPDLLDDDAVVALGLAGTHAGLQHVAVHFAASAAPGPSRSARSSIMCTSLSVCLTRPSGAKSRVTIFGPLVSITCDCEAEPLRHVEERLGIEPHALGEGQPFRQRQAVEPEDEIDRELGAAAVAGLADVEAARKQRIEHAASRRPRSSDRRRSGRRRRPRAPARWCPTPAFRESGCRCRRAAAPSAAMRSGIAGAGAEHDRAGLGARQQRLLHHLLDLVGAEHREHDRSQAATSAGEPAASPPSAASRAFFAGSTS